MKKKIIAILLAILLIGTMAFFTGCSGGGDNTGDGGGIIIDDDDDFDGDGETVDKTNHDTAETGFVIDGTIDETEQAKYVKVQQKLGVDGQVMLSYYIGEKGLYFYYDVSDPKVFKGSNEFEKGSNSYVMDSDRVELFIDTKADGGSVPKDDDFHILVSFEGYSIIRQGTGSGWQVKGKYGLDAVGAVTKEGTTVTAKNKNATSEPSSSKNVDAGYSIEFFMSYKNFGFSKKTAYNVSVGQSDEWSVTQERRFRSRGSNTNPSMFMPLTSTSFAVSTELEKDIKIDGEKDSFYTPENANNASNNLTRVTASRQWAQKIGASNMTTETYIYLGEKGVYIYMNAKGGNLKYYYEAFPYKSDHVEIRIDANNNAASDQTDRWMFMSLTGELQQSNGIDDDNRTDSHYQMLATMVFTGEVTDATGSPSINAGSTDEKSMTFEAFIPWETLNVASGNSFGLFITCGNPSQGSGIGNVLYTGADYSDTDSWNTFLKYSKYNKFARP